MSRKKTAPKPAAPKDALLHLPVTKEQMALLAPAVAEYEAAQERVSLVFSGIMASHGRTKGTLVALEGGAQPKVTIRVNEPEGT